MYRFLIRPLLFALPSETAHRVAMHSLQFIARLPFGTKLIRWCFAYHTPSLGRQLMGLRFANPLGIAAGFDKNADYLDALSSLGFGFIEIGTVTPRPQPGNPRPRLFRLIRSRALINRMGFNNDGCLAVAHRLAKYTTRTFILGANIGKNKDTPNDEAVEDYLLCFDTLHPYVDYFVVNVSSPNTPGLRALQEREPLMRILDAVVQRNAELKMPRPLLLKIAPDLSDAQIDDIADIVRTLRLDGLIVSNTTISREGLVEGEATLTAIGAGGLSGTPLQDRAQNLALRFRSLLSQDTVLIGVGGIDSPEAAARRLVAGASLIQVYTGFIYEGPGIIRRILRHLEAGKWDASV